MSRGTSTRGGGGSSPAAAATPETDPIATAALAAHKTSTDHTASNVTINASGLAVVTGANVQAALASLDAWANGRPTNETGTLAAMPANGARPNNSTYFATDQYGGTTYRMVAGAWMQQSAGVTQASGQMIAGPVQLTSQFDVKAVGVTVADVTGMSLAVPASSRPVLLRAVLEVQSNSGTAAAGAAMRVQALLTDNANTIVSASAIAFVQVTASAVIFAGQITLEKYLPAPVAAGTYKIRALLLAAAPANWTSALLLPNNSTGAAPADNFYALAC